MSRGAVIAAATAASGAAGWVLWSLRRRYVAVTVRGPSMEPAFRPGDRVIVRRGATPRRGSVVVVEQPSGEDRLRGVPSARPGPGRAAVDGHRWVIKRVEAGPGDLRVTDSGETERIPPGCLYLLGDNPPFSVDSRQLGLFSADRVLGVVRRRI
ncbi:MULTISPECIES: signal peptidase I [Streptomyces]|uniref:Signal peptidase I n=1 Tax=Streptomyces tsukubensis (strain DSM 42081 / NBRC 108919 / NRRL 18488 / 9993) TaxID=1114943 RepID=I2N835_STRT9|nr:signal peptidase I [Streptomyces tsukubensis]MYS66578.1 signal peptidase I [Streptomyces sp. SID5473]AZK96988.1 signal peptidase I [Streptomyces tsukubensis]EIF93182.1 hypothetical protein [Streptomyces tsukubensis NRRL18488]QKM67031.1 signal peptidase I [Streptomyces tsukubensis NRRL18488]TAI41490.1 signal peptidase I [Streptomyces tsukubensis]